MISSCVAGKDPTTRNYGLLPCGWRRCCWRPLRCCRRRQWRPWLSCRGCPAAHAACTPARQVLHSCPRRADTGRRLVWGRAPHRAGSLAGSAPPACSMKHLCHKTTFNMLMRLTNQHPCRRTTSLSDSNSPLSVLRCAARCGQVGGRQPHLPRECIRCWPGEQRVAAVLHHQPGRCDRLPGGLQRCHCACGHGALQLASA